MKLSSLLFATTVGTSSAFTSPIRPRVSFGVRSMSAEATEPTKSSAGEGSDFGSSTFAANAASTAYDRIGFSEDKVAMGVDPVEILQWLGTRDDLIRRFLADNPKFDQERAEAEVDKFVMDAEMVNKFIAFEKKKSDPSYLKREAEETLSDPSTWGIYAAWLVGGVGFGLTKNLYIEPKYASGEWDEIHIDIGSIFNFGGQKAVEEAVNAASDVATSSDVVSNVIDAIQ